MAAEIRYRSSCDSVSRESRPLLPYFREAQENVIKAVTQVALPAIDQAKAQCSLMTHITFFLSFLFGKATATFDAKTSICTLTFVLGHQEREFPVGWKPNLDTLLKYLQGVQVHLQIVEARNFTRVMRPALFAFLEVLCPVITKLELSIDGYQFHLPQKMDRLQELIVRRGRFVPEEFLHFYAPQLVTLLISDAYFYKGTLEIMVQKMPRLQKCVFESIKDSFGWAEVAALISLSRLESYAFCITKELENINNPFTHFCPEEFALFFWNNQFDRTASRKIALTQLSNSQTNPLDCIKLLMRAFACGFIALQESLIKALPEIWNKAFNLSLKLEYGPQMLSGVLTLPFDYSLQKPIQQILPFITHLKIAHHPKKDILDINQALALIEYLSPHLIHLCLCALPAEFVVSLLKDKAPLQKLEIQKVEFKNSEATPLPLNLHTLTLKKCKNISHASFQGWFQKISNLVKLEFLDCQFKETEPFAKTIAMLFPKLQKASFSNCKQVTDAWIAPLANGWSELTELDLESTQISENALRSSHFTFPQLTGLSLRKTSIGDAGLKHLAEAQRQLLNLNLDSCALNGDSFKFSEALFKTLTTLSCRDNQHLDTHALTRLAEKCSALTTLDLREIPVSLATLRIFYTHCPKLNTIFVDTSPVCPALIVKKLQSPRQSTLRINAPSMTDEELALIMLYQKKSFSVTLEGCAGITADGLQRALFKNLQHTPLSLELRLNLPVDDWISILAGTRISFLTIEGSLCNLLETTLSFLFTSCTYLEQVTLIHKNVKNWPLTYPAILNLIELGVGLKNLTFLGVSEETHRAYLETPPKLSVKLTVSKEKEIPTISGTPTSALGAPPPLPPRLKNLVLSSKKSLLPSKLRYEITHIPK